jgi:hypothetical protein
MKGGANHTKGISKNINTNEITPNTDIFTIILVLHASLLSVYIISLHVFYYFGNIKSPEAIFGAKILKIISSSFIQTLTVGSGIQPDQPFGSRALPPVRTCTSP